MEGSRRAPLRLEPPAADYQSCVDTQGLAVLDVGTSWEVSTYLPDGTFVAVQSVSNPSVSIDTVGVTRHLRYSLVPASSASAHQWLISGYHVEVDGASMTDAATGQPVALPTDPAAPGA